MNGEGHFLALLEKQGEPRKLKKATGKNSVIPTEAKEFLENWGMYKREWQYYLRDERLYALGKKDGMPENLATSSVRGCILVSVRKNGLSCLRHWRWCLTERERTGFI